MYDGEALTYQFSPVQSRSKVQLAAHYENASFAPSGVRARCALSGLDVGYRSYPQPTVAGRDVASNISTEIARQICSPIQKAGHYLPSTSLAIVASCMFDVPS